MALSRSRIAIIILVGVVVLVAIITPIAYFASRDNDEGDRDRRVDRSGRVDCFPESRSSAAVTLSREACEARGCAYDEEAASDSSLGVACYYSKTGVRYAVGRQESTDWGFRLHLQVLGKSPFGLDFLRPVLDVHLLSDELIRFTFDDLYASPQRYRVPLDITLPHNSGETTSALYEFKITDRTKLSFVIIRKATGTVIFDTGVGGLVLSEQFLQLASTLPSDNVYGLGEHSRPSFRRQFDKANAWPAFSRDQAPGVRLETVRHYLSCPH